MRHTMSFIVLYFHSFFEGELPELWKVPMQASQNVFCLQIIFIQQVSKREWKKNEIEWRDGELNLVWMKLSPFLT